jgi:hypothetical protein
MPRKVRQVYTNFSAGELNPLLNSRTDAQSYFEGAKQCRNWFLLDEGGLMRRPATSYLQTLVGKTRLIPFVFSEDEVAIFALSDGRLDVYDVDGAVIQSNITSGVNWVESQLFELNFAQFGDTVFLTHRDNPILEIKRTSATTFTVSAFQFEIDEDISVSGVSKIHSPFYKYDDASVTVTLSTGATGTGRTVTASSPVFLSDCVGHYLKVDGSQMKITGYTDASNVTVTIIETVAAGAGPHYDWEEELISDHRGYPQAVSFHDNRLWFGGVKSKPSAIVASEIGGYRNFDVGTGLDNESINVAITSDKVNEVRHLVSSRNLQIFTDAGEYFIPSSDTTAITPSNVSFLRQTPYGCNRANPTPFDGATLFSQKNGKTVREFVYSDLEQAYKSTSVSVLASQLIDTPKQIAMLTGNNERPEQFAFFLNNGSTEGGKLAVFHSIRDEKIAGWTMWETKTNDKFYSIISVNENLFVVTERVLPSGTVYLLEKFSDTDSVTLDCSTLTTVYQKGSPLVNGGSQSGNTINVDGFTSDPEIDETFTIAGDSTEYTIIAVTNTASGYTLTLDQNLVNIPADNAVITIVNGFKHTVNSVYEANTEVNAVYGNGSLGLYTIDANNRISLTNSPFPSGVRVGFNFTPVVETMPIDKEIDTGPLTGQPKRINKVIIDMSEGLDLKMKTVGNNYFPLVIQQVDFTVNSDVQKTTGRKEFNFLGYSKSPTINISQNDPLPLKILGLAMEVTFA